MPVAGRHSVIGEIFEDAVRSLSTMVTKTTDDQFRRAVKMLTKARRIFVVSNGPSVIFAQDFANYSQLCGLQTEFWPDTIMQNVVASKLGTKDVCVGVSLSGGNALTVGGVETAAAAGAKVLAVTGYQRSPLVDLAKVAVVAETFDFSTIGQAAINSAAMLLTLRSLVIATANEVYASATAGTQHFHASQSTLGRFAYRQPEGQANGAAKWRVR
jgi:DNA-binding MurR/RpiR family transcriptional regulator